MEIDKKIKKQFREKVKNSLTRGYNFELTLEQFANLIINNCYYCNNINKKGFNGIDRMDNNIGYLIENCVPSCSICNYMKGSKSKEDYLKYIKDLTINFGKLDNYIAYLHKYKFLYYVSYSEFLKWFIDVKAHNSYFFE